MIGHVGSKSANLKREVRFPRVPHQKCANVKTSNRFAPLEDSNSDINDNYGVCKLEGLEICANEAVCKLVNSGEKTGDNKRGAWEIVGTGEITIDSAADESCWPVEDDGLFEIRPSKRNIVLKAANGQTMQHLGEKEVIFTSDGTQDVLGMRFQVTEVRKPLAAVWRLAERGNLIQFGPSDKECFIHNVESGQRIPLARKG